MNPAFNDPFSSLYDAVSLHRSELPKYAGCYVYDPDNHEDYQCLSIWQPAPELGAPEWTRHGKRILLGIYRDEGRPNQRKPMETVTWTRASDVLTVICSKPHYMARGDEVELANVNQPALTASVVAMTSHTFTVMTTADGSTSGVGAYSPVAEINFVEDYVVFRLLPLFKPVSVQTVFELLANANPQLSRANATLTNIATGEAQLVSEVTTRTSSTLYRSHRQQLDELMKPLRQVYDARGQVIPPDLRFNKTDNARLYVNVPMVNQYNPPTSSNPYLPAYDFYGFPLNDSTRGPFYRTDIVHYNSGSATGLSRFVNANEPVYAGKIHDVFGDYVVGARSNNTLVTRKPVQPLRVDHHNTPYKTPIRRG